MREEGLPRSRVLKILEEVLRDDTRFKSGKILGSMCTEPHSFAKLVYSKFPEKNIGDPGLVKGTAELERECVRSIGSLLSNQDAYGHLVSGGTEANIIALWAARNRMRKDNPEAIVPESAHHSFQKACDLLGVRLIEVPSDHAQRVDAGMVKKAVGPNTIIIVGTAGTTDLGLVDPIDELSGIAEDAQIPLHVDASFGGFILPFLEELGKDVPQFDFRLPGVTSIAIDPHKMGMAPIPSSLILCSERNWLDQISSNVSYLSGGERPRATLLGTTPGASVLAVWSLINLLGRRGYCKVVNRCMKLTEYLYQQLTSMNGVRVISPPTMNILGFKVEGMRVSELTQRLRSRGWAVSAFPEHIRVVLMPHLTKDHIDDFLESLAKIVEGRRLEELPAPEAA